MKKKIYRIRREETSNGRLYVLQEGTIRKGNGKIKTGEKRRWVCVCTAYDKDLLKGVEEDILRELRAKVD